MQDHKLVVTLINDTKSGDTAEMTVFVNAQPEGSDLITSTDGIDTSTIVDSMMIKCPITLMCVRCNYCPVCIYTVHIYM